MEHYKSWSGLNKQLKNMLCDTLKSRIKYFLTRYHDVHNAYGRAAILLDNKEIICFSWIEMYHQDNDLSEAYAVNRELSYDHIRIQLKEKWDYECEYCEMDFLEAVTQFRSMSIQEALDSDNYIIKILAIMDKRVGKRKLKQIAAEKYYDNYPVWVQQFYTLRLGELV